MSHVIEPIARLSAELAKLPGIGTKTAQRLAYFLLSVPEEQALELANAITHARKTVVPCPVCGSFTDETPCSYCRDTARDDVLLCVVQEARDIAAVEKSREYRGRYHVLGGAISPMEGVGPEDIRIAELIARVRQGVIAEVILATNSDVDGEATATYIASLLKDTDVRVTRLAHGLPIGGNLEYADGVTLARALLGRREV